MQYNRYRDFILSIKYYLMVEICSEPHFMSTSHKPRRRVEYPNVEYDHIVR